MTTPQEINDQIKWAIQNHVQIKAAMPMTIEGVTHTDKWVKSLGYWMRLWRDGKLSMTLANAYIYQALERVKRGLNTKTK